VDSRRMLDCLLRQMQYQVSCRKGKIAVDDTVFRYSLRCLDVSVCDQASFLPVRALFVRQRLMSE